RQHHAVPAEQRVLRLQQRRQPAGRAVLRPDAAAGIHRQAGARRPARTAGRMNRTRTRLTGAVAAASVLVLAAAGCGSPSDASTYERVRDTGVLRIGYANEAPFAYQDSTTGELTGEAPAIVRLVADDLGIAEVEGVLTEFGSLIPGLLAGRFDMIAAGMYVTPARCAQVAFSEPTYSIGEDRKSTRLNSSHVKISYAVFCLKK